MSEFPIEFNHARTLPEDFGNGWMTNNARDMMRIQLLAGIESMAFGKRLALTKRTGKINTTTVLRIAREMEAEGKLIP